MRNDVTEKLTTSLSQVVSKGINLQNEDLKRKTIRRELFEINYCDDWEELARGKKRE